MPLFFLMKYFEQYERRKKAKSSIQVGSRWRIMSSTLGSGGTNTVGRSVIVAAITINDVVYYYDVGLLANRDFTYNRPIDIFRETFRPIVL